MRLSRTTHWIWAALVLALTPAGDANAQLFPPWGQQEPEQRQAPAGDSPPPQGISRGENFSAGKSGSQLFASDCTGAGCHRGPQGLGKGRGAGTLASFLREHYTNSRESAVVLSNFLAGIGGEARPIQAPSASTPTRPPRSAARPDETAKPEEPRQRRPATGEKPADPRAKPVNPRTAQPVPAPSPASAPHVEPEPSAPAPAPAAAPAAVAPSPVPEQPAPPPAPAKPSKPEFDIFD